MNKTEKRAYKTLIDTGYLVEYPVKTKWHRVDFFGMWDFIAVNKEEIRFIQVSSRYFTDRKKEDQDAMLNFPVPKNAWKEYWHYKGKPPILKITFIDEAFKKHIAEIRKLREK